MASILNEPCDEIQPAAEKIDVWKKDALSCISVKPKDNWCSFIAEITCNNKLSLSILIESFFKDVRVMDNG